MSNDLWRWADPNGQQRSVRLDELRAALASGVIAPNTPVWKTGWRAWQPASDVPELTTSALSAQNGIVPNIPPPPLAIVAVQHQFEASAGAGGFSPPPANVVHEEPPPPPRYVPTAALAAFVPPPAPAAGPAAPPAPAVASASPAAPAPSAPDAPAPKAPAAVSLPTTVGLPSPLVAPSPKATGAGPGSSPSPMKGLPTTIGLPPPPALLAMAEAAKAAANEAPKPPPPKPIDPMIEELSGSMLLDESVSGLHAAKSPDGIVANVTHPTGPSWSDGSGSAFPPPAAVPHEFAGDPFDAPMRAIEDDDFEEPAHRPNLTLVFADIKAIREGRAPRNKLLLGVLGALTLSVVIMLLAVVVSLFRGGSSDTSQAAASASAPSPSASVASAHAATATTTPTDHASTAAAAAPTPPSATKDEPKIAAVAPAQAPSGPAFGECSVAGNAKLVAPRAVVGSGVEAVSLGGSTTGVALGFATAPRDGTALMLDPSSLATSSTVRGKAVGADARRVMPALSGGKLIAMVDVDRKGDKLAGRRSAATTSPIDLGVTDGALGWAPHGQNSLAKVFLLEGEGPVEALRAVPLSKGPGIAVTFRRGGAIYVGVAKGEGALAPVGGLVRLAGLGQVGSPAITTSGDDVFVAWSDRANAKDAWQVRWAKATIGASALEASPPTSLALPAGGLGTQAMSPSVGALGGGRFLVAWTEGPVSNHQVRAIVIGEGGAASGAPLAVSASGVNAGQPQLAVGADGRGVVAFLASKGKAFELYATPIRCTSK